MPLREEGSHRRKKPVKEPYYTQKEGSHRRKKPLKEPYYTQKRPGALLVVGSRRRRRRLAVKDARRAGVSA